MTTWLLGKPLSRPSWERNWKTIIVATYQYLASSYATQTNPQNSVSSNDVVQLTLFCLDFIVFSHQINDSNSIEANDGWDV